MYQALILDLIFPLRFLDWAARREGRFATFRESRFSGSGPNAHESRLLFTANEVDRADDQRNGFRRAPWGFHALR